MHGPSQPQLVLSLALTTLLLVCFLILPPHYSQFPLNPWTFLMTSRMMSSSVENNKSEIRILDIHSWLYGTSYVTYFKSRKGFQIDMINSTVCIIISGYSYSFSRPTSFFHSNSCAWKYIRCQYWKEMYFKEKDVERPKSQLEWIKSKWYLITFTHYTISILKNRIHVS